MKKYVWLPLLLMAVIGSAAVSTKAQSTSIRANVPFDFIVGDITVPAGTIITRRLSPSDASPLVISNFEKSQNACRLTNVLSTSKANGQGKLVFHRYGNRYYLAEVWTGSQGAALRKSKTEKALAREMMLSKNSAPEVITLIAEVR